MKRRGAWNMTALTLVLAAAFSGCAVPKEAAETGASLRTQLQKGADTFEISLQAPEEVLPYLEATPFTQDVSSVGLTLVSGEHQGNMGYLVLYGAEEYDALEQEEVPLEEELLRDTANGVVLAYGGTQDAVFEQNTAEAELVQRFQEEIEKVKNSFQMEKVSGLPEKANMQTVLQLGERRYTLSFAVPENLVDYMSFGAFSQNDAAVTVRMAYEGQTGNVGTFVLYDAAAYDALKQENLPLETELLRVEGEGIVLAYSGIQDSVFEPGTEAARMVLRYQEALGDILETVRLEKSA